MFAVDGTGKILYASAAVRPLWGRTPANLLGRDLSKVIRPARAGGCFLERYRLADSRSSLARPRRFRGLHRSGRSFPIEVSVFASDANHDASCVYVIVARNASALVRREHDEEEIRNRLREEVSQRTKELEDAHLKLRMAERLASIGTLAAGLGHDMNNVLLPIRANLNAARAAKSPTELSDRLTAIHASIAYLQQLADGLHYLAMDPETPDGSATDLASWWSQVGPLLSKAVPRHVRVVASIRADLPRVAIAPHRLTQAVLNLVVNAGEAIPAGRKRVQGKVRIHATPRPARDGLRQVRLAVTDNGNGMSDEVKRRAFEMYFTTKPRGLGTGLGLPLVVKAVSSAGGSVHLESTPGVGTSVSLDLPVVPDHAPSDRRPVRVAIALADRRTASLIESVLAAGGALVSHGDRDPKADVWIVTPSIVSPARAREWLQHDPARRLVVVDGPRSAPDGLDALDPIRIPRTSGFDDIRAALARAIRRD